VLFRAETLPDAVEYIKVMFGGSDLPVADKFFIGYLQENMYYLIFGILFSMPIANKIREFFETRFKSDNAVICILYAVILLGGLIFSTAYLVKGAYNPFIYFNF